MQEQKIYKKSPGGMFLSSVHLILNFFCLFAGISQFFIVALVPHADRSDLLQELFSLAFVPVPEKDYSGQEQVILLLCLMAHVLSSVCVIYVVGRAIFDPKFTAGQPKSKRLWPLLLAAVLVIVLRQVLWWNFKEFTLDRESQKELAFLANIIFLFNIYTIDDGDSTCLCFEKPWRVVSGTDHLEHIKCTLGPGISSKSCDK